MSSNISIIIPCYKEGSSIEPLLQSLQLYVPESEIIISDGSKDRDTKKIADIYSAIYTVPDNPSRPSSMNHGANMASNQWLLFLHADMQIQSDFSHFLDDQIVGGCLTQSNILHYQKDKKHIQKYMNNRWGIQNNRWYSIFYSIFFCLGKFLDGLIDIRSRLFYEVYGDQGIFVRSDVFAELCGYKEDYPLFEDLDLYTRLGKRGRRKVLKTKILTKPRKQLQIGIWNYRKICLQAKKMYKNNIHPRQISTWVFDQIDTHSK